MNEKHQKFDQNELISLYLDGQATERQKTELKRLIQHDPTLAEHIKSLYRQKKILNALPVETAPPSMVEDIRSALERNLILDDTPAPSASILAGSHLAMRRMLAMAAMILVPLGLLGLVVFQIIKPATDGPGQYIRTNDKIADADSGTQTPTIDNIPEKLPFKGTLVLHTDQYLAVSAAVKEAIEKQQLIGQAFPQRSADMTQFQVTAAPRQVAELIDALTPVRTQCQAVALQVAGDEPGGDIVEIANIKDDQLQMLLYEDNAEIFNRLATRYASANQKVDPLFEQGPALEPDGYPSPSIPTLAGTYETADRTVELTIQIERADQSEPQSEPQQ